MEKFIKTSSKIAYTNLNFLTVLFKSQFISHIEIRVHNLEIFCKNFSYIFSVDPNNKTKDLVNFHPIGRKLDRELKETVVKQENDEMMRIKSYASMDVNYIVRGASVQKRFRTKATSVSEITRRKRAKRVARVINR